MKRLLTQMALYFVASGMLFGEAPSIINYQGRLLNGTNLVNGNIALALDLYNTPTGGTSLYKDTNSVTVVDGLYSTYIGDNTVSGILANALTNSEVWLEVTVNGTKLNPRERLAAAPYALQINGLRISNNSGVTFNPSINNGGVLYSTIAGGQSNTIGNGCSHSVISGGNKNTVNDDSTESVVVGGENNLLTDSISYSVTVGGLENAMTNNADQSVIVGGYSNTISNGSFWSALVGGDNNLLNSSDHSVIGGGEDNVVTYSDHAVVVGGSANIIGTNADWSIIGGGTGNGISNNSKYASVIGGVLNNIGTDSRYSTIGGGYDNNIVNNSSNATIAGGANCDASSYSFSAGRRAKATNIGCFVWADSNNFNISSTNNNSWTVRATGGARFISGISGGGSVTSGAFLASGSGTWTSLSDVNSKENFREVSPQSVLSKVAAMPIREWNYKTQDDNIRHIGPTAQDFRAAFGVGDSPTGISSVDADGVALAAIQGLYQVVQHQQKEIQELKRQNEELMMKVGSQ